MVNNKSETFNIIIFIIFLIISSGSSSFSSGLISIFIFFIGFFLIHFNVIINNKRFLNALLIIVALLSLYVIGLTIQFNQIPKFIFYARYVISFMIAYAFLVTYKGMFFYFLEKAIYFLVVVSIILFAIQLISFFSLYNPMSSFFNFLPIDKGFYVLNRQYYASILVYTINISTSAFTEQYNCGFVYEPGYFSFFINLGILINLAYYGLRNKKRLFIYIIALITTFSTTGIISFMVIMLFYFVNAKLSIKLAFMPFIIASVILFFDLSYGFDKVETLFYNRQDANDYLKKAQTHKGHGVSMGRFTGLEYYASETWQNSPIFGLSGIKVIHEENIGVANGTAHFIRNFGFLGLILMLVYTYKSSIIISKCYFNTKFPFLIFLFIQLCLFAFPFANLSFFWILIVMPFVISKKTKFKNLYIEPIKKTIKI